MKLSEIRIKTEELLEAATILKHSVTVAEMMSPDTYPGSPKLLILQELYKDMKDLCEIYSDGVEIIDEMTKQYGEEIKKL